MLAVPAFPGAVPRRLRVRRRAGRSARGGQHHQLRLVRDDGRYQLRDGKSLNVGGSNNTLRVTGTCASVSVGGADNTITVSRIDGELSVVGLNNTVRYQEGDPRVNDQGRATGSSAGRPDTCSGRGAVPPGATGEALRAGQRLLGHPCQAAELESRSPGLPDGPTGAAPRDGPSADTLR